MEIGDFIWIIIAIVSAIIEGATLGLTTIWFAFGAVFAWIAQLIGFGQTTQIIVFLVLSTILIVFTRPIAIKYLKIGKVRTNADKYIGESGIVIEKIVNINNKGQVKVNGQIWSAKSLNNEDIEKDTVVLIKEIKGVKLIVEKINNQ